MEIRKLALDGVGVRLEPMAASHLSGLGEAIADGELWKIPLTLIPHPAELPAFLAAAESAYHRKEELAFATIDKTDNRIAGGTRFRYINVQHRRVEIGITFIAESKQRTHINTEAKYLMLAHAFESWRCNRVELIADVLNVRSRNAIARIGATEEGILRNHMIMGDGRVRHSVMFSITAEEWPRVKRALELKMNRRPPCPFPSAPVLGNSLV